MDHYLLINGLKTKANFSEAATQKIFIPLLRRLNNMQKEAGRRIVVFLAGPPGAGKSTLVAFLESLSSQQEGMTPVQSLGMDSFHHYQDYLLSHFITRNGETIPLVKIKGSPITFDVAKMKAKIKDITDGKTVTWPVYDRTIHNPIEDVITVNKNIILIEGNYLLLEEGEWKDLAEFADYTIFMKGDEAMLRRRLIDRKVQTGVDEVEATKFVDRSDMSNLHLILHQSRKADLTLKVDGNSDFHIVNN